jgi:phospholipid transport system transporter-binding protein
MKLEETAITNRNAARVVLQGNAAIAGGDCTIDFSAVTRCDTAAVACVLAWMRAAALAGRTLTLLRVPADLHSLAKLYGVDALICPAGPDAAPTAATLQ